MELCFQIMHMLLQTKNCPGLPLPLLLRNTAYNCQSSFFVLPNNERFYGQIDSYFSLCLQPHSRCTKKIRNQREVTLVHEHLLKDSLNEFHSTVLLVNFLDLKLWGREGICSLPIGAINKPNLYSSVCSLE